LPYDDLLETAARIGLDEERFWRMTPREFKRRVDAYTERQRERAQLEKMRQDTAIRNAAWIVATVMNFSGKQLKKGQRVKIEDLIRKPKDRDPDLIRMQLIRRHRLTERFGIT